MGKVQTWLKEQTKVKHLAVEKKFLQVASVSTVSGYENYLSIMLSYHEQFSLIIEQYCKHSGLKNNHNKLIECLKADMSACSYSPANLLEPLVPTDKVASLGIGYVIEGSSLGSAILHKQLKKFHDKNIPDSYFIALQEEQPERWLTFISELEKWHDKREELKLAAIHAFNALNKITSNETESLLFT